MIDKTGGSSAKIGGVLLGDTRAIRGGILAGRPARRVGVSTTSSGSCMNVGRRDRLRRRIQSQGAAFKMAQATEKLNAALIELGRRPAARG
jgi:hypothetical protein